MTQAEDEAHKPSTAQRVSRFSLAGRITVCVAACLALAAMVAVAADQAGLTPGLSVLFALLAGLPLATWLIGRTLRPFERLARGLGDGIRSFSDRDFSVRLADHGGDELSEIARLYNQVAETLQRERHEMRQRELLLAASLDSSPVALILVGPTGHVIYSNVEARTVLLGGGKLEGYSLEEILDGCPEQMRAILASSADGVFSIPTERKAETYSLSRRVFQVNQRRHTLLQLHRITSELERRESEVWKKVIRVISHELNNSLAPVSSLVHSARVAAGNPEHAHRSEEIFHTIQERLDFLKTFIDGYARFARLPPPDRQETSWHELLSALEEFPEVKLTAQLPARPGFFDRSQVLQLLINLLKNAVEACDGEPEVALRVRDAAEGGTFLQVMDRGKGMDEDTMKRALLPFYSTKLTGSGLGLPLCREIVEAHGGKLSLQARRGGGTIVTCWFPSP